MIAVLDRGLEEPLTAALAAKAKPAGSLGRLEELAVQIGLVSKSLTPFPGRAALVIFAGDHGITAEGVTAYPSEVSAVIAQMVLDGTAGGSLAARAGGADVFVADAGLLTPLAPHRGLISKRIGAGTRNFLREPAMTANEAQAAFEAGAAIAGDLRMDGYTILALGEIGIGNSSSASLICHAVSGIELDGLAGSGAGLPPRGIAHKRAVLHKAYTRAPVTGGWEALREFGGFETAMLAGALFAGARAGQVLLIDGFIATAAACAARAIDPNILDYLTFAHLSPEAGHRAMLTWLGVVPLLDLRMRLGEGTGAALAIPLVRMAASLLSDMADLPGTHPRTLP